MPCALSVVFAGHGVKAVQEAGAQALALLAIVILYGRSWRAEKRRAAAS
ncbi:MULTISPECIES: hypothetical protein [unclassified Pseudomonas]